MNVLKKLRAQVRKWQFISDWLDLRQARREDRELMARYEADMKTRPQDEREYVWSEYSAENQIIWEPIYVQQTKRLVARAHKYGVQVPQQGHDDWEWSHVAQDWILSKSTQDRLKREINVEERQSEDEFRKWATLGVSVAAFILAVLSLILKGKQPDPCPKNYYRNDQGECVFALQQKPISPPQQSTTPTPSVQRKKPFPANPKL